MDMIEEKETLLCDESKSLIHSRPLDVTCQEKLMCD